MTAIISRPSAPAPSTARRVRTSDAERRFASRRRLVHRGVVASYLHDISARNRGLSMSLRRTATADPAGYEALACLFSSAAAAEGGWRSTTVT